MHTNTAILLPMKKINFKKFSAVRFLISIKYYLQQLLSVLQLAVIHTLSVYPYIR
jgi:uncharacterized protein (DUF1919 family)